VEFDKDAVSRYRLVGYENRDIADKDFRNDKVDAGEIGAGHTVTAIYEVELKNKNIPMAVVRVRHKTPRGSNKAKEKAFAFDNENLHASFDGAPQDLRFASAVMASAELLRASPYAKDWSVGKILRIAQNSAGGKEDRQEFVALMKAMRGIESQLTIAFK
jgi:Ca-activated chloride channel family protein